MCSDWALAVPIQFERVRQNEMKKETEAILALATREAHRVAQKVSLATMVATGIFFHIIQRVQTVAAPDEMMLAIFIGMVTYKLASQVILPFAIKSHEWHMPEVINPPS